MKESKIEKAVNQHAISKGWLPIKMTSPNMQGVPDHLYIGFGNKTLFVEFKQPNGKLSPQQVRIINKFKLRGVPIHVIDTVEDGKRLIDDETRRPA